MYEQHSEEHDWHLGHGPTAVFFYDYVHCRLVGGIGRIDSTGNLHDHGKDNSSYAFLDVLRRCHFFVMSVFTVSHIFVPLGSQRGYFGDQYNCGHGSNG